MKQENDCSRDLLIWWLNFHLYSTLGDGVMWLAVVGQITFADSLK